MREIKFRGLVKEPLVSGEKWISSDEEYHEVYINRVEKTAYINGHEVVYETVSEFTGLKDKNGKEIYEGDIVYFTVFNCFGDDKQYKGVVKFAEGQWQIWNSAKSEFYGSDGAFALWWVNQQDDEFEIIGNIHENPELLEGTE